MAERPKRIQRRRTTGWRMPEGAIYVGRRSPWGNQFHLHPEAADPVASARIAVELFRADVLARAGRDAIEVRHWLSPLRGHDLACWCSLDEPSHADVLLELANG